MQKQTKNVPYVKQYEIKVIDGTEMEVLINPITKENPYVSGKSPHPIRKMRPWNNRKEGKRKISRNPHLH